MSKIEIDNKKMWESIFRNHPSEQDWINICDIKLALKAQGLTVNDKGEITTIEPEVKWYVAMDDYGIYKSTMSKVPIFCKGEMTTKETVYTYFPNMTDEEFNKHFRPATEEETPQESKPEPKKCLFTKDLYTDEERKELCKDCQEECEFNKDIEPKERKVSGVLKKMLDNIDEESLAKTREEMQKTPEIAEFDKAIETLIGNIDGDYCVYISSYDDYINKFAPKILAAARKLIASEIDATQMTREMSIKDLKTLTLGAAYYQGIVNTIKKIKGESI